MPFTSDYSFCWATKISGILVHSEGTELVVKHSHGAQKIWVRFLVLPVTELKAFTFSMPHFFIRGSTFFPTLSHVPVQCISLVSLKNGLDRELESCAPALRTPPLESLSKNSYSVVLFLMSAWPEASELYWSWSNKKSKHSIIRWIYVAYIALSFLLFPYLSKMHAFLLLTDSAGVPSCSNALRKWQKPIFKLVLYWASSSVCFWNTYLEIFVFREKFLFLCLISKQ